jgi:hypothetical protein
VTARTTESNCDYSDMTLTRYIVIAKRSPKTVANASNDAEDDEDQHTPQNLAWRSGSSEVERRMERDYKIGCKPKNDLAGVPECSLPSPVCFASSGDQCCSTWPWSHVLRR